MKKILLVLIIVGSAIATGFSQSCSPDSLYADSLYGAWPDTVTNFPAGQVGVFYSQILDFKIPADAGEIDTNYAGVPLDSVSLTDVTGLPPGLSYVCDNSNCSWLGGEIGCASLYGTPTTPGTYDVVIELEGYITFIWVISEPAVFTGYVIEITPAMDIIVRRKDEFSSKQNSPNPFSEETWIEFSAGKSANVDFRVMDIIGNVVHQETVNANVGENRIRFKNSGLSDGIYMYTLSNGERSITKKMIVKR